MKAEFETTRSAAEPAFKVTQDDVFDVRLQSHGAKMFGIQSPALIRRLSIEVPLKFF